MSGINNNRYKLIGFIITSLLVGVAGIILASLMDTGQQGSAKGFDVDLIKAVTDVVSIPVIASGGMGRLEDIRPVIRDGNADAVAMAHVLHYDQLTINDVREFCIKNDFPVRSFESV